MFAAAAEVAAVLGLTGSRPIQGQLDLAQAPEEGLPVGAVDRVSRLVAPGDPAFRTASSPAPRSPAAGASPG